MYRVYIPRLTKTAAYCQIYVVAIMSAILSDMITSIRQPASQVVKIKWFSSHLGPECVNTVESVMI